MNPEFQLSVCVKRDVLLFKKKKKGMFFTHFLLSTCSPEAVGVG